MKEYNSAQKLSLVLPNKEETAKKLGIDLKKGDNGHLTTFEAGKIGGAMGGNKVRQMIKMAEKLLVEQQPLK